MRVLAITQIFPNAAEPLSAPFNRQQLAELGRRCQLEVAATLPWFPGAQLARRWSAAGRWTRVPARELIDGLPVLHPRALYVPRVGRGLSAPLYAASLAPLVASRRGQIDVVLGTWAYPDGCAAVLLARMIGVPAVVKLHGSDLNVIGRMPGPRMWLRALLPRATRVVAVSRALAGEAEALGVPPANIRVVHNGVDQERFRPADRAEARASLGLSPDRRDRRLLLYVGHLKESKGVLDLADAFARLAARDGDTDLVVIGDGEARAALAARLDPLGPRAHMAGARPHEEVPRWMAAADLLVLPSWNEGTPNVVIEALSAGRRVVATAVGGVPDLVSSPVLGALVPPRQPEVLAAALERELAASYDPDAVAAAGRRGSWQDSADRLHAVLEEVAR